MDLQHLLKGDAGGIVERVLGVQVDRPTRDAYDFDLTSGGIVVGSLLIVIARRSPSHSRTPVHAGRRAELINDIVEQAAWTQDTVARLDSSGAPERHLFVWLHDNDGAARSAMQTDAPPGPPLLPPGVTTLWVARRARGARDLYADRTWQTDDTGEWEPVGPVRRPAAAVATAPGA